MKDLDELISAIKGSKHYGARQVVEKVLGKPLPKGAVVHHIDENPRNHSNNNLLVCPSEDYHNLIHLRTEAFKACGNANFFRCYVCKCYDDPQNMLAVKKANRRITTFYHSACRSAYRRAAYRRKRAQLS